MTVYVTQWLCPSRHALIAVPWEDTDTTEAEIVSEGDKFLADNRECDLCKSTQIVAETARSIVQDFDETLAICLMLAAKQRADRERILEWREN